MNVAVGGKVAVAVGGVTAAATNPGSSGVAGVGCEACDYDGSAAGECLVAFEDMSCEEFVLWRSGEIGSPADCSDVFTGCDVAEDCA